MGVVAALGKGKESRVGRVAGAWGMWGMMLGEEDGEDE